MLLCPRGMEEEAGWRTGPVELRPAPTEPWGGAGGGIGEGEGEDGVVNPPLHESATGAGAKG